MEGHCDPFDELDQEKKKEEEEKKKKEKEKEQLGPGAMAQKVRVSTAFAESFSLASVVTCTHLDIPHRHTTQG